VKVLISGDILKNAITGVETYTVELARRIADCPDVELSILAEDYEHVLGRFADQQAPDVHLLPSWPEHLRLLRYALCGRAQFQQYDLIHTPVFGSPFMLSRLIRRPGRPKLVVTCHDLIPVLVPEYHEFLFSKYFKYYAPRFIPHVSAFIANSEQTKADMMQVYNIPPEKIRVTYLSSKIPVEPKKALPEKEDYLLGVSTIEPRKNFVRVVEAFLEVIDRRPDLPDKLIIVGRTGWGGVPIPELVQRAKGRVEAPGYVDDAELERLYRGAKALVYPSLYEGFGLPVLEAMAAGCPVITSNTSSLPEVGGDAVLYADPESVSDIAHAIDRVLTEPVLPGKLMEKGLARAGTFSWERMAEQTVDVYCRVMAGEPACPD